MAQAALLTQVIWIYDADASTSSDAYARFMFFMMFLLYLESTTEYLIAFEYLQAAMTFLYPAEVKKVQIAKYTFYVIQVIGMIVATSIVGHWYVATIPGITKDAFKNAIIHSNNEFEAPSSVRASCIFYLCLATVFAVFVFIVLLVALLLIRRIVKERSLTGTSNNFLIGLHLFMSVLGYFSLAMVSFQLVKVTGQNTC